MIGEFCNHTLEAIINSFSLVNLFNFNSIYWSKYSAQATVLGPVKTKQMTITKSLGSSKSSGEVDVHRYLCSARR